MRHIIDNLTSMSRPLLVFSMLWAAALQTIACGLCEAQPPSSADDRAALTLGYLLIRQQQPAEALVPLRRAANLDSLSVYARLLLARAVVEGQITEAYEEAAEAADSLNSMKRVLTPVREEAGVLRVKIGFLQGGGASAIARGQQYLKEFPKGRWRHETGWLMAQAQIEADRFEEAHATLEKIWFESPESPWAPEALTELLRLESERQFPARQLTATAHYDFIKALRAASLHTRAVQEVDLFLKRHPSHSKGDGALFLRAMSLYSLRKNDSCVATVDRLWREYPQSKWLPAAGVYAIRAHRRSDSTPRIKAWVERIWQQAPQHERAFAALYELGTYQANVVDISDGIRTLESLVEKGGAHSNVTDSLWKLTWYRRKAGQTEAAIAALERLLEEHPRSGYRVPALFWLARFLEERGTDTDFVDTERAIELYQSCWRESPHSYYGHRAQARLMKRGIEPMPPENPAAFPAVFDRLDDPRKRPEPAYRRVVDLKAMGLHEFAALELEAFSKGRQDLGLKLALAELYSLSGRTRESDAILLRYFKNFVKTGSRDPKLVPRDFWKVVYPFSYRLEVEKTLIDAGIPKGTIDPYLVASLILQESRFQPEAVSPVGAIGLMQLMPATAKQVASQIGLSAIRRTDLFDPKLNIRLGTLHLAQRIADFRGDRAAALSSYNADIKAVRGWWSKKPEDLPIDEFIETIPYLETRIYVKKILGNYENYRWIYTE